MVDRYKSGFPIPEDVQFEDLSQGAPVDSTNSSPAAHINTSSNTLKGGTVSGKSKKRGGIFGLFGSSKVGRRRQCDPEILSDKHVGILNLVSKGCLGWQS